MKAMNFNPVCSLVLFLVLGTLFFSCEKSPSPKGNRGVAEGKMNEEELPLVPGVIYALPGDHSEDVQGMINQLEALNAKQMLEEKARMSKIYDNGLIPFVLVEIPAREVVIHNTSYEYVPGLVKSVVVREEDQMMKMR